MVTKARSSTAAGHRPSRAGYAKGASSHSPRRLSVQPSPLAPARHGSSTVQTLPNRTTAIGMKIQK